MTAEDVVDAAVDEVKAVEVVEEEEREAKVHINKEEEEEVGERLSRRACIMSAGARRSREKPEGQLNEQLLLH